MRLKIGAVLTAFVGLTFLVGDISGQTPASPAQAPAQGGAAPAAPAGGRGRQAGGGRATATFPAQQRAAGDPAVIARGKTLYSINCQACHGVDLRGGDIGGPNLLRSQVVLSDQHGELIEPIVHGARPKMPALSLNADDTTAVAEFIHSVVATARNQGAPPGAGVAVTNIVVGNAAAGKTYFDAKCSACHSATGDLQGLGDKMPDAKILQNFWVSAGAVGGSGARGRGGRGGGGAGATGAPDPRAVTATVTLASGEKVEGRLVRVDDFIVTVTMTDGTVRSFRRDDGQPKVDVHDPMDAHRALFRTYTDKDVHDVTAYLVTLK